MKTIRELDEQVKLRPYQEALVKEIEAKLEKEIKEAKAKIELDAQLKVCHNCYAFTYNGTKICSMCGWQFYQSKKDLKGD